MKIKFFISVIFVFSVLCLSSCKAKEPEADATTSYRYISMEDETTSGNHDEKKSFTVDKSWQKNFSAVYEYYNPTQDSATMHIKEIKSEKGFIVENTDKKTTLYYKPDGQNTHYYFIAEGAEEQVHSLLKGKSFGSLSSLFMKLTAVDGNLPLQHNVLYMYDEEIAGRPCRKYIQRAYSEGKQTQTVYVWIDIQYGFSVKCESYDAGGKLNLMWTVKEFSAGTVSDSDAAIDLSQYKTVEKND